MGQDHDCEFGIEKFRLLDIAKKRAPHPLNPRNRILILQQALVFCTQHIPLKESWKKKKKRR